MSKMSYHESIEIIRRDVIESYVYRRAGENLGTVSLVVSEAGEEMWVVFDFMEAQMRNFKTLSEAKKFIGKNVPIMV